MAKREGKNEPEPKTQHMSQASTMPPGDEHQHPNPWLEDDGGYSIALPAILLCRSTRGSKVDPMIKTA